MKIKFRDIRLNPANRERLSIINGIIGEYQRQNLVLTLRQLYYQLVSRDVIPNKQTEYSKLSTLLKEGRMSGVVDWDAIEDRLRQPSRPAQWDSPQQILEAVANQYRRPRMNGQKNYIEVWVEKDALSGVLKRVTEPYGIPILVNRGYSSASAMFDAYERFKDAVTAKQKIYILYLGDFDPSGLDMIRDIRARTLEFMFNCDDCCSVASEVLELDKFNEDRSEPAQELLDTLCDEYEYDEERLCYRKEDDDYEYFDKTRAYLLHNFNIIPVALTRAQIRQYNPPQNPAKRTDPRAKDFIEKEGTASWEVDALRPEVLNAILTVAIENLIDLKVYNSIIRQEELERKKLKKIIKNWE